MSPVVFSERALTRKVKCRSFYLDLDLLLDFWVRREYPPHDFGTPRLRTRPKRWPRSRTKGSRPGGGVTSRFTAPSRPSSPSIGLVAPAARRPNASYSLNTVRVPEGVDDAVGPAPDCWLDHRIEIGAGLGPLAGKVFRVGAHGHRRDASRMWTG